jgi:hypothetical protein
MTDRRRDEAFAIAPRAIGGGRTGRSQRRRVSALVVLGVAAGLVALAGLGPRLNERPSFNPGFFATDRPGPSAWPSPSPTPTGYPLAYATPLPAVTRNDDGRLTGRVGFFGEGFRLVDLASGVSTSPITANPGSDLLVASPSGDGYTCICMVDEGDDTGMRRQVQFVRINPDGAEIERRTLLELGYADADGPYRQIQADIDLLPDGRRGVIAFVVQNAAEWRYEVASIDLVAGRIGPRETLGVQHRPPRAPGATPTPSPDPAEGPRGDEYGVGGPTLRIDPAGDRAVVWGSLQAQSDSVAPLIEPISWIVPLDPSGEPATPVRTDSIGAIATYCGSIGFIAPGRLIAVCPVYPTDGSSTDTPPWWLYEIDGHGSLVRKARIPDLISSGWDVFVDAANEVGWVWDQQNMRLSRIDLRTLDVASATYPAEAEAQAGAASFGGVAPSWVRLASATYRSFAQQMVGSPSGDRLYLVAVRSQSTSDNNQPPSLGILVVDPHTMALVGHWDPDAWYVSAQLSSDGTSLIAQGAPNYDASGAEVPWEASLTFHDVRDGRILLRLGQLGQSWGGMLLSP